MELHLSILQSHSRARQSRIQCWGEDCDQGEPEQHNRPWHDRTPELLTPFDPFTRPTVDRTGTSAAIIDHHLRFQSVHPGQSLYKIHHEFPGVTFVDHIGGDGRLKAEFKPNAIPFSIESNNAKGLDTVVVEATYLIDAAVLRAHVSSGVTLCAKNLFGATSINTDWRKNAHDGFHHNKD